MFCSTTAAPWRAAAYPGLTRFTEREAISTPASFALRPARETDRTAIHRLIRQVGINPTGLDWQRFTVAVDELDQVVGCGQVKNHRAGVRELASLAVAPAWRGRGMAGAIMRELMHKAGPPLWLMCRSSLVSLYAKFGFDEVGPDEDQPGYFRRMRTLAGAFLFVSGDEYLAIMTWPGV